METKSEIQRYRVEASKEVIIERGSCAVCSNDDYCSPLLSSEPLFGWWIAEETQQSITCQGAPEKIMTLSSWWFHSRAHEYIYGRNGNGPENMRRPGNFCWSSWKFDVHAWFWMKEQIASVLTWSSTFIFYRDNSIKNPETEKRGSENGHEFRNMKTDHNIHQWWKFLSNSKHKSLVIKFIAEECQNERHREKLAGKTIFVITEDNCNEDSSIGMTTRQELRSTQEETNTRVFLHGPHAAAAGYRAVVITSDDTDVFVLLFDF